MYYIYVIYKRFFFYYLKSDKAEKVLYYCEFLWANYKREVFTMSHITCFHCHITEFIQVQ